MIYFDQAATTKLSPKVSEWIKEHLDSDWMNPSSMYAAKKKGEIEECRQKILWMIGADNDDHLIFTSGGSESNALMMRSAQRLITTEIEHDSILNCPRKYVLPVDTYGMVIVDDLSDYKEITMQPQTVISVQYGNNEIGTIQDISAIRNACTDCLLHVDAVQAVGHMPIGVKKLGIDLMSASAHKFGGPKGIGFLYVSKRAYQYMNPIIYGTQENSLRGSTYNYIGIMGMTLALEQVFDTMMDNILQTCRVRMAIYDGMQTIPCAHLNGPIDFKKRLPGNLNYRFDGYRGEELQAYLAQQEIYVSTGSACNTGHTSHVLKAIGLSDKEADSSLRITYNETNTVSEALTLFKTIRNGLELLA